MPVKLISLVSLLLVSLSLQADEKNYLTTRTLSLALADKAAMAAVQACQKKGYRVGVAVTDRNGTPIVVLRDPLSGHHTLSVAEQKAYTAASFQTSTLDIQNGRFDSLNHVPKVLVIGGGRLIRAGGHIYGAIGVSGAPVKKVMGDIDDECASEGIEAIRDALEFAD